MIANTLRKTEQRQSVGDESAALFI